jgi:hypothetical protein
MRRKDAVVLTKVITTGKDVGKVITSRKLEAGIFLFF